MDPVETLTKGGFKASVSYDEHRDSPRIEYDNAGTMVCWHSRYNLGDKHDFANPNAAMAHCAETDAIVLPLFLYDHSGITMSTSPFQCRWDSGQVGYIFIEAANVRKEWGEGDDAREKAISYLQGEVKTYDQFLTGDVYSIVVEDDEGNVYDSCCGFYGRDYAVEEAQGMLDAVIKEADRTFVGTGI